MTSREIYSIGFICLRFIGPAVCSIRAKKINRSVLGWGIFGFFLPIIAMILIQFMKTEIDWDNNDNK